MELHEFCSSFLCDVFEEKKKLLILQYQSVRDCATAIKCAAHTLLIFSNTYTFEWQTLILIGGSFHCLQCQIFLCAFIVISQCHWVHVSCVHRTVFAERGKLNKIPDRQIPEPIQGEVDRISKKTV